MDAPFTVLPTLPPFRLRVVPTTLTFKKPAGTSRGVYLTRRLWRVVLSSASPTLHFTGLGECAPLHDLSADYDETYEQRLRSVCQDIERSGQSADLSALRDCPSMKMGLETAFFSAAASLRGDHLHLFPSTFTSGENSIPINGLVWMGSQEEMLQRMEEKLEQGFHCVKLKIGALDFDSELSLIRTLRARFSASDVELRLDANGGFSVTEALQRLHQLEPFRIHSIEQPIRQGQWKALAELCQKTPIPIALDEELIGVHLPEEKKALLDTVRPQFLVLKPTLHGGFTGAEEWISLAREREVGYWVTSALESNIGLNAIAQWTAALHEHFHPDHPALSFPQGLGTGSLFITNFSGAPLCLEGEHMWCGTPEQRKFNREAAHFRHTFLNAEPSLSVQTSGSTGQPQRLSVEKKRMVRSAEATLRFLRIPNGSTALLCLPLKFIAGQMMVVRSLVGSLSLRAVCPSSRPLATLHDAPFFAAMTPMQVFESLRSPHDRRLLRRIRRLLIGGGSISPTLEEELRDFPNEVWSSYGMTETLSHIALRRLNGPQASETYRPLPGVRLSLSSEGTLIIDAPGITDGALTTNDLAEISGDGSFRILGRRDNVICSGGLKLRIEELETRLASLPVRFFITSLPDERLGEAVTLLFEPREGMETATLDTLCRHLLPPHAVPRRFVAVPRLPFTDTGKPARAEAKRLALKLSPKADS